MIRFVKAKPTEFLVVGRKGVLRNEGIGGSATLPLGATSVKVPSVKQEAHFGMTQESVDGVPLRFKGIVVFRVVDPVAASACFDFISEAGLQRVKELISHICLGELRALVSHMTMKECIEQRKSALSGSVGDALRQAAGGGGAGSSWGIDMEIVQVAQVFIVDEELRDQISARSERSHIEMEEQVELARVSSQRRLAQESLENERQANSIEREKVRLDSELKTHRIEATAPLRGGAADRGPAAGQRAAQPGDAS